MSRAFHNKLGLFLPLALALSAVRPGIAAAQDEEVESEGASAEAQTSVDSTGQAKAAGGLDTGVDYGDGPSDQAGQDTEEGRAFIGSRADRHTAPRTLVPVAILTSSDLAGFHGPSLISPAALRGLGPDRVLVLVNGKRRHQMAQINVDEAVGRGSSGTDLNGIPIAAIERVEILRDSAAPLYGPNAMGGVINIVLKERTGLEVGVTAGNYYENDGNAILGLDRASASVNSGIALGEDGFLNLTLEVRDRGETNRAGIATIASRADGMAFGGNWFAVDPTCPPDDFDPTLIPPCRPVRRLRFGNADGQDYYFFYNAEYEVAAGTTLYSFGGISRRIGDTGAGLFLGTGNGRVPAEFYPDGFLPTLITTIDDLSVTAGGRFELGGPWELDTSATYGQSSFNYDVENSVNTSWFYEINPATGMIYAQSPTSANSGKLINSEVTINLDLKSEFDVLENDALNVGLGTEFRVDNYEIVSGDFVSYSYGRTDIVDPDNPIFNESSFPLREPVVGGIQGFPGFAPEAAVNDNRLSWGAYIDAEQFLTDWWLLGLAGRFESVQFTGESVTGRIATRFDLGDTLALRGSLSNGSRAPDVQKIYFSHTLTAILPSGLTETATVGDANPLRGVFGIGQLKPEKSLSASGGIVVTPDFGTSSFVATLDAYQVQIKDRIILSDSVTGQVPEAPPGLMDTPGRTLFRDLLDQNQLGAAQFFVNGADTITRGIDVAAAWGLNLGAADVDLGGAVHYSETRIEDSDPDSQLVTQDDLFGVVQRNRLQKGQPRYTGTLAQVTSFDAFAFRFAFNYYGAVTGKAYMAIEDEKEWSAKVLTDASFSYSPLPELTLTIGGDNIFDVFPDEWGAVGREYPEIGYTYGLETLPFGVNGGFYYLTAEYTL